MKPSEPLWTLDELCDRVTRALAEGYRGSASGRVRDVPDRRTIRYYTTLGLIDRPAAFRGRSALYGRRHLLQLVAIERLQSHGLPLTEVQARLLGLGDAALAALAQVPPGTWEGEAPAEPLGAPGPAGASPSQGASPSRAERPAQRDGFWREAPAEPTAPGVRSLVAVPLAEGASLLLEGARPPDDHDLAALQAAAAPLIRLLHARRLLGDSEGHSNTKGEPA